MKKVFIAMLMLCYNHLFSPPSGSPLISCNSLMLWCKNLFRVLSVNGLYDAFIFLMNNMLWRFYMHSLYWSKHIYQEFITPRHAMLYQFFNDTICWHSKTPFLQMDIYVRKIHCITSTLWKRNIVILCDPNDD